MMPDKSINLYDMLDDFKKLGQILYDNEVVVTKLAIVETSLEDYYMHVIGGNGND